MLEYQFPDLHVGLTDFVDWDVTEADIDGFAALSGDSNPLHMDASFARANGFSDRVSHGMLLAAKVSALVGMRLPGKNCLILETKLDFPHPVYAGDQIRISGSVDQLSSEVQVARVRIRAERVGASTGVVGRGYVTCRVL